MSILDKTIRLVIGFIWIVFFGVICDSWWWLVGALPILTAVYGCPLYYVLGKCGCKCCAKKDSACQTK